MCGIIGALSYPPVGGQSLETALDSLHHRGPDDRGIYSDEQIQLGHVRLSIIDLSSKGHQPMPSHCGRYWISCNGEIYNFIELKRELVQLGCVFKSQSDTEVLLEAYAQWGSSCLNKLVGMFSFAIWDKNKKELFLARDRTGEKPLYYWSDNKQFVFSSELKSLLHLLPSTPRISPAAMDAYLHNQYVPEPETALEGIHKLPAAHFLVIRCDQWTIKPERYWCLTDARPVYGNPAQLVRQQLERSMELTLRSDVPVGVALSGGIDSGIIATLAASMSNAPLSAFSVGYPGRPPYDERSDAAKLAIENGIPFFDIELKTSHFVDRFPELVTIMDDPIGDIAAYGHYAVMELASDHGIKVMLSGIGGDELFWGYEWMIRAADMTRKKMPAAEYDSQFLKAISPILERIAFTRFYRRLNYSQTAPKPFRDLVSKGKRLAEMAVHRPDQLVLSNLVPDFQHAIGALANFYTPDFARQIPHRNPFRQFSDKLKGLKEPHEINMAVCKALFETWLVSNCLSLGDRVSMDSSVEARCPFLNHRLIETVIGIMNTHEEVEYRHKALLKTAVEDILPTEVLHRPKQGFQPPVNEWMTQIVKTYYDYVKSGYLISNHVTSTCTLDRLLKRADTFGPDLFLLYKITVLELWYAGVVQNKTF
ncbi:asparagine synthase (glutamine-hydrolyzing) [Desulfoluna butyratoxydans]|uniref:asparagine synthase (glutamine-hydrolyzing) n=1 Tax=Desulfoluna butyratoxydans TaxID=231438 RepID=A0A4U8YTJ5_9BACT|nr:asparagine synthase (glutamine-hydrolyzing) [Desulfoluna butyratoxydans]VFQ47300.1 asparagine synthase glutamine-hydrolyzing [Desulfoluna butyratoxydans]